MTLRSSPSSISSMRAWIQRSRRAKPSSRAGRVPVATRTWRRWSSHLAVGSWSSAAWDSSSSSEPRAARTRWASGLASQRSAALGRSTATRASKSGLSPAGTSPLVPSISAKREPSTHRRHRPASNRRVLLAAPGADLQRRQAGAVRAQRPAVGVAGVDAAGGSAASIARGCWPSARGALVRFDSGAILRACRAAQARTGTMTERKPTRFIATKPR